MHMYMYMYVCMYVFLEIGIPGGWHSWRLAFPEVGIHWGLGGGWVF